MDPNALHRDCTQMLMRPSRVNLVKEVTDALAGTATEPSAPRPFECFEHVLQALCLKVHGTHE